jgi:hypothetical protein
MENINDVQKSKAFDELVEDLEGHTKKCKDIVVDLRYIEYHADDEEQFLYDTVEKTKYFFKLDIGDAKSSHALKQWCKSIGVPYPFFKDNRPVARKRIVDNWLASLAPKEGDEVLLLLKIRKGVNIDVIRAVLPVEYTTIPYADILKSLTKYPAPVEMDLDSVSGSDRDDLLLQVRVFYNESFGEMFYPAVSITASDLGASELIVDILIMHQESKSCVAALYGKQPFAKIRLTTVQPAEVFEILESVPARVQQEMPVFLESLEAAREGYPGVERACVLLSEKNGVPKKFKRAIHLEAQECHEDMDTLDSFLWHVGSVAKSFSCTDRLKIERAAGEFSGLSYKKA